MPPEKTLVCCLDELLWHTVINMQETRFCFVCALWLSHGNDKLCVTKQWLLCLRIRKESKEPAQGLNVMTCSLRAESRAVLTHHTGEDLGQSLHGSQGLGLPSSETVLKLVERLADRVGVRDLSVVHKRDVPDSPTLEDERRFTFTSLWSTGLKRSDTQSASVLSDGSSRSLWGRRVG